MRDTVLFRLNNGNTFLQSVNGIFTDVSGIAIVTDEGLCPKRLFKIQLTLLRNFYHYSMRIVRCLLYEHTARARRYHALLTLCRSTQHARADICSIVFVNEQN